MSNINIVSKFLFVHVPKTGGTSMTLSPWNKTNNLGYEGHITLQDFKDLDINIEKYFKWAFVRNPWDRLVSGYDSEVFLKDIFPTFKEYVKFAYDNKNIFKIKTYRWLKHHDNHGTEHLFKDKNLKIEPWKVPVVFLFPQSSFLTVDEKMQLDFIGRFEQLHQDWEKICNVAKQQAPPMYRLLYMNESNMLLHNMRNRKTDSYYHHSKMKEPYQTYYDADMVKMVEDLYEDDIVNFNYKF